MKNRIAMLKVKIKSIAEEAKIIRHAERKSKKDILQQTELWMHRVIDLRKEQRSALLAYGFLRGRSLKNIEANSKTEIDTKRVLEIVLKFGNIISTESDKIQMHKEDLKAKFKEWVNAK